METTNHTGVVRGVGSSNLPVPTNPLLMSNMEAYLQGLLLTRKKSTENRSRQILLEASPLLTVPDPKPGVMQYLTWCKARGNCNCTLSNKLIRLSAFYRSVGIKLDGIPKPKFVTRTPEIYSISAGGQVPLQLAPQVRQLVLQLRVGLTPPAIASNVGSSRFRRVTFLSSSFLVFFNLASLELCRRQAKVQDEC